MKQEFVTVGQWTLRCDDVSGVSAELDNGKWWLVVMGRFGTVRCDGPWADVMALERTVLDAIGYKGNPPGRVG